jgi:hypothetical protein
MFLNGLELLLWKYKFVLGWGGAAELQLGELLLAEIGAADAGGAVLG